jgi:hypothetical protein
MTPSTEHLLLNEVQPRLRNAILHRVPVVGSEDQEELLQDGLVIALHLLIGARRSRKNVTGASVAYYTVKSLRSGRRSMSFRKTDPLHPAGRLNGRCRVHSLEEPINSEESVEEPMTLGEMLPARDDDPATQACRRLDWNQLAQHLDGVTMAILDALTVGHELSGLIKRFRKSRSTLQNHKDRLGRLIKECMGEDILLQIQELPGWRNDLHAYRERLACRWEQSAI